MNRRVGTIAAVALSAFLLCGMQSSPTGCQPSSQPSGPSEGAVIGTAVGVAAAVVVGAVVLVEVNKAHHTVKGCVTAGADGLLLRSDDEKKTYKLVGASAGTRVGDLIKLHGLKKQKQKDAAGDSTFVVEKITKDYGPCKVTPAGE